MNQVTKFYLCILPPQRVQRALVHFQETVVPPELRHSKGFHLSVKTHPGLTPDYSWLDAVIDVAQKTPSFSCSVSVIPKLFPEGIAYLPVYSDQVVRLHRSLVGAVNPPEELSREYYEKSLYTPHISVAKLTEDFGQAEQLVKSGEFHFYDTVFRFPVEHLSLQMRRPGEKHYSEAMRIMLRG